MKTFVKILLAAMLPALAVSCGQGGAGSKTADTQSAYENETIETIMTRRSIRQYKDVPVGRDTMQIIAECGINAPNGMNRQSWEVRIVDNPQYIDGITALFKEANPRMASDPTFKNMFRNAPTVVFVANDPEYGMSQIDCGLLGGNMMLAAKSLGIGSCCLGGPVAFMKTPAAKDYLDRLGFSEGYELLYAIAFGYPAESPDAKPRDISKVKFVD